MFCHLFAETFISLHKGNGIVIPMQTSKAYMRRNLLILVLDEGEWSASCPGCFTPRERAPVNVE
jgi:hypothetical protein